MSQLAGADTHSPQVASQQSAHNPPSSMDPVYEATPRGSEGSSSSGGGGGKGLSYSVATLGLGNNAVGNGGSNMAGGSAAPGPVSQQDPNLILLESRPSQPIKHAGEFGPRTNFSALSPSYLHLPGVEGVSRHGLGPHVDIDIPAPSGRRHFADPSLYPGLTSAGSPSASSPIIMQSSSASAYKEWDPDARSLLQPPMHLQGAGR
jgi:hypothetical protein